MTKHPNKEMDYLKHLAQRNPDEWDAYIWPPFTQISSATPPGRVLQGDGALLIRENAPPLIDAISSWWVTLHGHGNPYIANAIAKQALQLEQVIFADFTHPQAELLCKRLTNITGLQRSFFSDNGSTAVEVALKISCQWWINKGQHRKQIIAFEGAYHGDTFGAMAVGERNLFNAPFEDMLFPVARIPWPSTWWGDSEIAKRENFVLDELEKLLKTPTIAVILEPLIQGAGGMAMVRPKFLKEVEARTKQSGALLIADEVMTGFGRCGSLFAHQHAGIKPNLIAISKGLTGGFLPMGITMTSEEIFSDFVDEKPEKTFWHGHSFTGNPLGCAAANASLDLLEKSPSAFENFESRHLHHMEKLSKNPKVLKPRIVGTIAAFNIKSIGVKGYLNLIGKTIKACAIKNGVFIRPLGDVVYILPPLCITDSQLEQCYFAIEEGLKEI